MGRVDSTIERSLPVFSEWSQPDVLFRLRAFRVPVVAPATLGGSDVGPARGLVDGAGVARGLDEGFDEHRGGVVALGPVLGQAPAHDGEDVRAQVVDIDPGQDEEPWVVDHEGEVLLAQLRRPSDELVARGELPRGGGEAEHGEGPPPSACAGDTLHPAPAARRHLRVPWPGAFDALQKAYRANRARIGATTVAGAADAPVRTVAFACELDLPPVRCAAFALRTTDDRPFSLEGARAVEVAAMVRHAIGRAARSAGLDPEVVAALMGHGGANRIRVAPLPTVGHRHADGWVRRVMLTAPLGVPGDAWSDVLARLAGAPLVREHARTVTGVLAPIVPGDAVLRRFRAEARRWMTATPVVLPGCDHRRAGPVRTGRSPGCSVTQVSPRRCSNPQRSSPRLASRAAPPRTGIGARATSPTTPSSICR